MWLKNCGHWVLQCDSLPKVWYINFCFWRKKYPIIGFVKPWLCKVNWLSCKKWHCNYIIAGYGENKIWTKLIFFISKNKFDINTSQQSCSIWSDFHISFRHSIIYICITSYTYIQFDLNLISTHKTCLFMQWYIWYILIINTIYIHLYM